MTNNLTKQMNGWPMTAELTDEEILTKYNELKEYYGDALANFEHYPRQFANQVRLYKYYQTCKANNELEKDPSENVVDFT